MKKVAIAGYDCAELPVLLSLMLNRAGHETAVHDLSKNSYGVHELISMYEDPDDEGDYPTVITRKNIIITSDMSELQSNPDVIINYYGERTADKYISDADVRILGTDMYAHHAKALRVIPRSVEVDMDDIAYDDDAPADSLKKQVRTFLFINDFMKMHKYGHKYIRTMSGHPEAVILKHVINITDLQIRHDIGYEKVLLKKLTPDYKILLSTLYEAITGEQFNKKFWRG